MRSVLELHAGTPYFAMVPTPLSRLGAHFHAFRERFARLESGLGRQPQEPCTLDAELSASIFRDHAPGSAIACIRSLRESIPCAQFSVKTLRQLNAAVIGLPNSSVRTDAAWMGARHPSEAWFVAPPARELPRLLRDLCNFCNDANLPPFLRGVVGLHQLVLIHPFPDGNGRTARALLAVMALDTARSLAAVTHLLDRLFAFKGMALQRSQAGIRDSDDWSGYLELCLDALHEASSGNVPATG